MEGVQINGSLQSLFGLVVLSGRLTYHSQQMIDLGVRSVLPKLLFADFDRLRMSAALDSAETRRANSSSSVPEMGSWN